MEKKKTDKAAPASAIFRFPKAKAPAAATSETTPCIAFGSFPRRESNTAFRRPTLFREARIFRPTPFAYTPWAKTSRNMSSFSSAEKAKLALLIACGFSTSAAVLLSRTSVRSAIANMLKVRRPRPPNGGGGEGGDYFSGNAPSPHRSLSSSSRIRAPRSSPNRRRQSTTFRCFFLFFVFRVARIICNKKTTRSGENKKALSPHPRTFTQRTWRR